MGTMSPITQHAVGLLSWEWQPREEIVQKLLKKVPPGRALRRYEAIAAEALKNTETGQRAKPPLSESEKIYSGARALAQQSVKSLVTSGRAELSDGPDGPASLVRFKDRRSSAPSEGCCPACNRPFVPTRQKRRARLGNVLSPRPGTTWGMPAEMRKQA